MGKPFPELERKKTFIISYLSGINYSLLGNLIL